MSLHEVNDSNFRQSIPAAGMALMDFGAPWCPPCRTLLPLLEELDQELDGTVTMLKVNCDDSPEAASAFGVMSMPTVVIFRDGQPVDKFVGLRPKEAYRAALAR